MSRRGRIRFDLEGNPPTVPDLDRLKAAIRAVMDTAGAFGKALWYQRAQDLNIRDSGAYLQGIQDAEVRIVEDTDSGGTLAVSFELVNTCPHAGIVEDGHSAFHLPDVIDWSGPNVKRTKAGRPFLRVPFGHAAFATGPQRVEQGLTTSTLRSMLPADVYARAKQLTFSRPGAPGSRLQDTTPGPRFVAGRETVEAWRSARTVAGRDASGARLTNPAWQTSRFQGLMKRGSPGHTSYQTIRVLTPDSAGWNIPAQLGHGVARQVAYLLNSGGTVGQRFQDLLVETARNALRGGTP